MPMAVAILIKELEFTRDNKWISFPIGTVVDVHQYKILTNEDGPQKKWQLIIGEFHSDYLSELELGYYTEIIN